jgi:hypothetical protein
MFNLGLVVEKEMPHKPGKLMGLLAPDHIFPTAEKGSITYTIFYSG